MELARMALLASLLALMHAQLVQAQPVQAQLAPQCTGGEPSCPCISSYEGFNVSSTPNRELVVHIDGEDHTYGVGYGFHSCKPHDSNSPPYCNVAGSPSWCTMPWCYVNGRDCSGALPSTTCLAST